MTTACKTERHDWYSRDNHIASLQQGALSKEEFESSKNILRSITKKVIDAQSYATYSESIDLLQN